MLSIRALRKLINLLLFCHYTFWSASGFLSAIYYLVNGAFRREQRAALSGFGRHYSDLLSGRAPVAYLRRNIHRIEKGLVMRPVKPVFAKNYIEATVEAYAAAAANLNEPGACGCIDMTSLQWFNAVLDRYFETVKAHPVIDRAARLYKITRSAAGYQDASTPMLRRNSEPLCLSHEEFLSLAKRRHSVRWFLDRPVERAAVDRAMECAKLAPSACNRLPYEFRFFDEPKIVRRIAELPMGTAGFAENIPVLCVIIARMDYYSSERDRHVPYIDASLAAMQFMLALETLGLGSCPINWPDFSLLEMKMSRAMKLKDYERPVLLIALGHPDPEGEIPLSLKKSIDGICSWNRIG